jgi:hypothetical protein
MRKVTEQILFAFNRNMTRKVDNTLCTGDSVLLHGNKIVKRENGKVFISTAGWNTRTTIERLNAFTNKRVYVKKGQLMLGEQVWDGNWTEA